MKSMKSFIEFNESIEYLEEKLVLINNGKKYGQIVFLAGGAGSGKGFASTNFMEKEKFKVRDVDEWKLEFMKIGKLKNKYPEIQGLDLKKPEDVGKLHAFVDKKGIKDNTMRSLLSTMGKKEILPNIMFDITAKNVASIHKMMPDLLKVGYNPANIHMVWVLTDYQVAIKNNRNRERVVPDDIMFQTHTGAANTMFDLIRNKGKKLAINGEIKVILNNRKNTILWKDDDEGVTAQNRTSGRYGENIKNNEPLKVIKDFTYLTIKHRGKPNKTDDEIMQQLYQWIVNNVPEGDLQKMLSDRPDTEPKVLSPRP
jgi:dephospho-CoA kinase